MLVIFGVIIMIITLLGSIFSAMNNPYWALHGSLILIIGLSISFAFFAAHKYFKNKETK